MNIEPYQSIENQTYPHRIKFEIKKKKFENVQFQEGKITFSFFNCIFDQIELENLEQIEFEEISIQFVSCFINHLSIDKLISNNISIFFGSSIISGKIDSNNLKSVSVNNCVLKRNLFLFNLKKLSVSYTEENIFPKRWKKLVKSIHSDLQNFTNAKQGFVIQDCLLTTIHFNEDNSDKLGFYLNEFTHIDDHKLGYFFSNEEKERFLMNVSLKYNPDTKHSSTKIIGARLSSLTLKGFSSGEVIIENTKIDDIYVHEYSSQTNTTFYNVEPFRSKTDKTKFEIKKSNLNNLWFDNVNFNAYNLISFYRTKFGNTAFTSCSFPEKFQDFQKFETVENIHYPDRKNNNYYTDRYEIFLQLHKKLNEAGNYQEALKFKSISNEALKNIKDLNNWDKFILRVNSFTNNHGLSIKEPFILLLGSSITLYFLYLLSVNRIFNNNEIDYNLIGYYFKFLDITHRSNFLVEKIELNGWSLFLDYLNKLLVGFFIYQFIAAFRKYGKN